MNFRVIAAVLLAALLGLLLYMAGEMDERYQQKMLVYESESAKLAEYEQQLTQLDAQVQELLQKQAALEAEAEELSCTAEELEAQCAALEAEKPVLLAEIQQIEAELKMLRETTDETSDDAYYLEVYDALTEGLETVKGYLTGN